MAILMTAVFDRFGNIVGTEPLDASATLQSITTTGESTNLDTSTQIELPEIPELEKYDLTTTDEIQLTSTDDSIAAEDVGKGVMVSHPVHLDVKKVGSDVSVTAEMDWDGGEW